MCNVRVIKGFTDVAFGIFFRSLCMNVTEKTFLTFYAAEPSQPGFDVGKTGQLHLFVIVLFVQFVFKILS